jgi:hypothetical protein
MLKTKELKKIYIKHFVHVCLEYTHLSFYVQVQTENVIQDIRYFKKKIHKSVNKRITLLKEKRRVSIKLVLL